MASHRYWRAVGLKSYAGGPLELTEFHLLDGTTRVDSAVTMTSNVAPTTGSLANLQDDDTATGASWTSAKGVELHWDFGVDAEVNNIRLGAASDKTKFALTVGLEWSDDDVTWESLWVFTGIKWPSDRAMTESEQLPAAFRAAGVMNIVNSNVSVLLAPPVGAAVDDLLLAVIMRRSSPASEPVGWELVSTAGPVDNTTKFVQYSAVYAKRATIGDLSGSTTFSQVSPGRIIGQMLAFSSPAGVPVVEDEASTGVSNVGQASLDLPVLSSVGTGRVGVVVASSILAKTEETTTWSVTAPWVLRSIATVLNNRLSVATKSLSSGESAAVTLTSSISADNNGLTGHAMIISAPISITRNKIIGIAEAPAPVLIIPSEGEAAPYSGTKLISRLRARPNFIHNGDGRVAGTVKENGTPNVPVRRRVRLIRERDGLLVQEQWSDALTGEYSFDYVEMNFTYTVLSYDHLGNFRAVVADRLEPEPMP